MRDLGHGPWLPDSKALHPPQIPFLANLSPIWLAQQLFFLLPSSLWMLFLLSDLPEVCYD